ncbi:hypothetical protein L3V86_03090 [Thiotrichales bacterium 19S11-10]|nr:hypothetical protein [Thiotrichales bacterium 19S11-10]
MVDHLKEIADYFSQWVEHQKKYGFSHITISSDYNSALTKLLYADEKFYKIETYDDLQKLSEIIKKNGYSVTNPPCDKIEFAFALLSRGGRKFFGDVDEVVQGVSHIDIAARHFYESLNGRKATTKTLLKFIDSEDCKYFNLIVNDCDKEKLAEATEINLEEKKQSFTPWLNQESNEEENNQIKRTNSCEF